MSLSTATTPRTSIDLAKDSALTTVTTTPSTSSTKARSIWESIKRHAKEHHASTNAAYALYYGQGQMRTRGQEVWEYKRGEYCGRK
ncbi:hypothetical protein FB567DRAFT_154700 [Paraphoma chrysanthemicola]|uniref:Uncharacterized protein n=1 Tax=Paraphoma chrysanthemicola TaxID=798071 RepID=A0A8K0QWV2_9PLEO|nr:hypothetical protein FB567DRAFT_154700 [Paraphoma chrysanthemicola]